MKKIFKMSMILLLTISVVSCSNKKVKEEGAQASTEEQISVDDSDFIVDAEDKSVEESVAPEAEVVGMETVEQVEEIAPISNVPVIGENEVYEVQKGETLMWIAFKLYGDYRKWKELERNNQDTLADGVQVGDRIRYTPGAFVWSPKGMPHLIKTGDTLATISNEKYGTSKKWKSIWDNNRDMIRNPDLIFAGFTLYYVPGERDLASDKM